MCKQNIALTVVPHTLSRQLRFRFSVDEKRDMFAPCGKFYFLINILGLWQHFALIGESTGSGRSELLTKSPLTPYLHGFLVTIVDHHRAVRTSTFFEELILEGFLILGHGCSLSCILIADIHTVKRFGFRDRDVNLDGRGNTILNNINTRTRTGCLIYELG